MKNKFFLICFLIVCYSQASSQNSLTGIKSDTVALEVNYNFYSGYTGNGSFSKQMPVTIFVGRRSFLSVTELDKIENVLNNSKAASDNPQWDAMIKEKLQHDEKFRNALLVTFLKTMNGNEFYQLKNYNNKNYWIADTATFNWKLAGEFKEINNYRCQKAIGTIKGDTVTAWFTEQIPVSAGPSYISGLPGLILEYHNPSKKVFYIVSKISTENIDKSKLKNLASGDMVSKAKEKQLSEEEQERSRKFQEMIRNGSLNKKNLD